MKSPPLFVDLHHDYISLFFTKTGNGFKISDDGFIMDELSSLNVDIKGSKKRKHFFASTLKIFGVNYDENTSELYLNFNTINQYPEMQQRLIQCMLRVSDMLLTSRNKVISFFTEDISNFFFG
ncbi:DUF1828 domain-containing protein [Virgibacillus halophilus]|uniref:DUF1828 domain-containing protein n=1 Tax=Tigheibacillus halophilus TaxID=361280 RepID=A0ABU5CCU7_9BACI|nr:DUF1828 domain-containing protein [Virgibacillus halophilus]